MLVATVTSCKEDTSSVTNYDNWESRNTAYLWLKDDKVNEYFSMSGKDWLAKQFGHEYTGMLYINNKAVKNQVFFLYLIL